MKQQVVCPVLVGRDDQLKRLAEALRLSLEGEAKLILLDGEAGLGKTRLATELERLARELGVTTLWGSCSEAMLSLPYVPFVEAVGNHLHRLDDMEGLRRQLGAARQELGYLFPALGLVDGQLDRDEPDARRLKLFEAVVALLTAMAAPAGLLLVVEDVHWADAATRELLDYLTRRLRGVRIAILVTYRGEELPSGHPLARALQGWRRSGPAVVVRLGPLSREDVGEMVQATLGREPLDIRSRDFLHARCEGNPFLLEELLKAAIDSGAMAPGPGSWDWRAVVELKLPETVQESVLLRVDRLPAPQVEILQHAAVLGGSFEETTLVAVTGRDEEEVLQALDASLRAQLLEEDPLLAGRYRFRHALTREAVYQVLLTPRRRQMHERIAEVLARSPGTPPVELCHHLLAAGRVEEAVPFCLEAAEAALSAHAYRDAAVLLEHALPHLEKRARRGEVECRLGHALLIAGDVAGAEGHLEAGVRALDDAREGRLSAKYRRWLSWAYFQRSRWDLSTQEAERAIALLEPFGPSEELADAYNHRALSHAVLGESDRALPMAQRAVATAEAVGADAARLHGLYVGGRARADLGRVDEGVDLMDRTYEEALQCGLTWIAGQAMFHCTLTLVSRCRPREALQRAERLRAVQGGGFASLRAVFVEGEIYLRSLGHPVKALPLLEEAILLARSGGSSQLAQGAEQSRAVAYLLLDRADEACRLLPPPEGVTSTKPQLRLSEMWAAMRIALDTGHPETVREVARLALECGHLSRHRLRLLADLPVEVLLASGDLDAAERIAAMFASFKPDPLDSLDPHELRIEGRLALAKADPTRARDRLGTAADLFMAAEMGSEESRTRWALAEALEGLGDLAAAQLELRRALRSASERGALLEERRARELLARLGVSLRVTPGMVKQALEHLADEEALARTPLRSLRRLSGEASPDLRKILSDVIVEVSSSSSPRDAEAGEVLGDYYLKKVGSHEVVAERLHLSRPTFYRRLHRGLELVAERLGPLDDLPATLVSS